MYKRNAHAQNDSEGEGAKDRGTKGTKEEKGNKRGSRRLPYFQNRIASAASIGVMIRGGTFAFLIGINRAGGRTVVSSLCSAPQRPDESDLH